jgi:hypothetical protein
VPVADLTIPRYATGNRPRTKGVFFMPTTDLDAILATYRCYRSNAIWFGARTDGYSITVRDGLTFSFAKGEMLKCAMDWLDKSREYWQKLLAVPGAEVLWCGLNAGNTTDAKSVDSQLATDCLCPDCTRRALLSRPAPRAGDNAKG